MHASTTDAHATVTHAPARRFRWTTSEPAGPNSHRLSPMAGAASQPPGPCAKGRAAVPPGHHHAHPRTLTLAYTSAVSALILTLASTSAVSTFTLTLTSTSTV